MVQLGEFLPYSGSFLPFIEATNEMKFFLSWNKTFPKFLLSAGLNLLNKIVSLSMGSGITLRNNGIEYIYKSS